MLVSLSDVLTSEGKVETVAIPLEMTSFKSRQGDFSIMEKTPIHLTFTNIGVRFRYRSIGNDGLCHDESM